jgi:heme/copper-type cytochrome/quinol oxidase subunit 4
MPTVGEFFRRAAWALLGFTASVPLHVAGLSVGLLVVELGMAADGPWPQRTQNVFMLSFAFWQWVYLLPAALLLRRRQPAMAAGLGASGCVGMLFALLGLLTILHGM